MPLFAELSFESFLPVLGAFLVTAVPLWLSAKKSRMEADKALKEAEKAERDTQITGLKEMIEGYRVENNTLRERLAVMEASWRKDDEYLRGEIDTLLDYVMTLKREIAVAHPDVVLTSLDKFRAARK